MAERSLQHPWIDLLAPDGPFLSPPALDKSTVGERWPTRLDPEIRGRLIAPPRSEDSQGWDDTTWDARQQRVHTLLTEVLGFSDATTLAVDPALTATHHIYRSTVTAAYAVHARNEPSDVRMVVICGPDASDEPERIAPATSTWHEGWFSTPVQRAALLARRAGADLALVTNGNEHLLVNVATTTTGSAFWSRNALEDRAAQDAFVALLHRDRVLHRTRSTADLIQLSQDRQQELTDTLGKQVRRAAEALVNAISRANRTTRGELLSDAAPAEVYSAATRVLMRIVFLLVAEERGLLPVVENELYATEYAASTLLDHLEEAEYRNRSVMQRQSGAWQRLMATSRAVHSGIEHHSLSLAAYGGSLFDPEEHPFLEGRVVDGHSQDGSVSWCQLDVGVVDDFTVLTVLRHLQIADGQRLSFKTLDVEQIGHVYEALLDHSAVRVPDDQVVIGLVGKPGSEPEVRLADLEAWAADGIDRLTSELVELEVGSKSGTITERLNAGLDSDTPVGRTLTAACGNDEKVLRRVLPFAPLVRTDARGMALVFLPGDVYVTETSSKRDSGTAYTPRSLAEEVARHTLDPLIYEPGPHNEADKGKWKLRSPDELLDLKICDPAVGSAAILVAAARYLAEALIQSRIERGQLDADALSTAADDEEALDIRVDARRDVVSNCVYGVDRDPMAVEMAKLSMWLVTMARDRPFTFLDHAIKCGDSLLGITDIKQLRYLHLKPSRFTGDSAMPMELGASEWWSTIDDALAETESLRSQLRNIRVVDIDDARRKAELHGRAENAMETLRVAANAVVAISLSTASEKNTVTDTRLASLGAQVKALNSAGDLAVLERRSENIAEAGNPNPAIRRRFLHWPLAFPEVFDGRHGFDAIVANPPFMGSQDITGNMGTDFRDHLIRYIADGKKGKSDLIGYFALRMGQLAKTAGFLATNSIGQGQTAKVSLVPLSEEGWTFFRAVRSTAWPGKAGVHISKVWMTSLPWLAVTNLDGTEWHGRIDPTLERQGAVRGTPRPLRSNAGLAFQGYQIVADGLLLSDGEAQALLAADPTNAEVVRRYVNGDTVNGPAPRYDPDRWVIDFGTMSETEAADYPEVFQHVVDKAKNEILDKAAPAASGKRSSYERWASRWWQFWSPRPELRESTASKDRVLALARTSKVMYPVFVDPTWCLTDALVVFAYDDITHFGLLSSVFHWWWAIKPPGTGGSSLETRPRYTPTTSFQCFPQPHFTAAIEKAAEALEMHREAWLTSHGIGLTAGYNRVNDPSDRDPSVEMLRDLHGQLDEAVRTAYADSDPDHPWASLDLTCDFHDCGNLGTRFTISEASRAQMLEWLLELNYRRWAEENGTTFEKVMEETGNA